MYPDDDPRKNVRFASVGTCGRALCVCSYTEGLWVVVEETVVAKESEYAHY